jgi:hypothetical protein
MDKTSPMWGTALTLGVIGGLLITAGAFIELFGDTGSTSPSSGVLIRAGAVLAATALVLPSIRRPSLSTTTIAVAGLVLVLLRPGLIWVALIGWVAWLIAGRQRRTADNES